MTVTCSHRPTAPWLLAPLLACVSRLCWAAPEIPTTPPQGPGLPPAIQQSLQAADIPASSVSLLVLPVDGGPARLSLGADTARTMASVMKLFTTGVALQ